MSKAAQYLLSLELFGIKPGLKRTLSLCRLMGNPHERFDSVMVGGTNGKGSTSTFIYSVLRKAGLRTGLYTSPHLERFNERISVDGELITDDELAGLVEEMRQAVEKHNTGSTSKLETTFFEFTTILALEHFRRKEVDIAVLEVGLGGRLDSVNICDPLISIITNVSMDHEEYLGNSLEEIALEKAGIIKRGRPLVCGERDVRIARIFSETASRLDSPSFFLGNDFSFTKEGPLLLSYSGISSRMERLELSLEGDHQLANASCALAACELLKENYRFEIPRDAIRDGIRQAHINGRLEKMRSTLPFKVVLDGAHNPSGTESLAAYLSSNYRKEDLTLMLGILQDKPYEEMAFRYLDICKRLILVSAPSKRSWELRQMEEIRKRSPDRVTVIPDIAGALSFAADNLGGKETLCITGSFYTVGEARRIIGEKFSARVIGTSDDARVVGTSDDAR